jgi:hypothetical protein
MNQSDFNQALEAKRERRLSAAEEARLRASLHHHPELAKIWQEEASLDSMLDQLPDVPVPSNFTALVLTAVSQPETGRPMLPRFGPARWLARPWLRRLAAASVLIVLLAFCSFQYHRFHQRQSSHDLVWLSFAASSVPEPEVFKDFDAIRRLRHLPPPTDDALFDVLTQ